MQETTKIDFTRYFETYQWPLTTPIPQSAGTAPPYRDRTSLHTPIELTNHLYRPSLAQPSKSITHPLYNKR